MGFNATVVVLLDRLDEIRNDPKFGEKLADAIQHRVNVPIGSSRWTYFFDPYVTGQTEVICAQHADYVQLVAVGGNTGHLIGYGNLRQSDTELISSVLDDLRCKAFDDKITALKKIHVEKA